MVEELDGEVDYEKKIEDLQEELKRKQEEIEKLKKEKEVLFNAAVKNSEQEVDARMKKSVEKK